VPEQGELQKDDKLDSFTEQEKIAAQQLKQSFGLIKESEEEE
jgi:hypothetical protein